MIVAVDACVVIVAAMLIAYRIQASSSGVTLGKATNVRTTFRDVAGIDEVKGELEEMADTAAEVATEAATTKWALRCAKYGPKFSFYEDAATNDE